MARIFGIPAALLGGMVTTYMGTELEETNMPLWASAYPLMGPLYAAVGMSTSTAALSLAAEMTETSEETKTTLNRLALASGAVELALAGTLESRWRNLPEAKSFERSSYAPWFRIGFISAGILMPLVLRAFEGERKDGGPSSRAIAASVAKLAGTLIFQFVMVYAGRESGRHARDYFEYTKPIRLVEGKDMHSPPRRVERKPEQPAEARRTMVRSEQSLKRSRSSTMIGLGLLAVGAATLVMTMRKKNGGERR
jgi:hypothetical protein